MQSIYFITTANLTTNPRLLKEIELAIANGFSPKVICFNLNHWSDKFDKEWVQTHPKIKVTYLSGSRKNIVSWLWSTFLELISKKIYWAFQENIKINAYASNKRSILLKREVDKISKDKFKTKFICAHNLGALYPVSEFARKNSIPFIFDMEDFHPGESVNNDSKNEIKRRIFLLKKLLPQASKVTFSSPLIAKETLCLLGHEKLQQYEVILNCFPNNEFKLVNEKSTSIPFVNFVWFSQNISNNRGLELIIPELAKFKENVRLHLIGNLYADFENNWIRENQDFIITYSPLSQVDLNKLICKFDIGLAIEPGKDLNNTLAISNKILAYFQAGLFILASDTEAQLSFIRNHKDHGEIIHIQSSKQSNLPIEMNSISKIISTIIMNIDSIRATKQIRFENAQKFSWDVESLKILKIWD